MEGEIMATVTSSEDSVLLRTEGPFRIVTLNRPDKMNAADLAMQQRIVDRLREASADPDARAIILTGAGKAFSAGGDRSLLQEMAAGGFKEPEALAQVHWDTIDTLFGSPKPIIAAFRGPAVGFAAGVVAMCDLVVMAEDAFFCDPHVRFGGSATTGTLLVWPRLAPMALVKDILMSGRRVYAEEAVRIGLANVACAVGEELETALKLAAPYAELPPGGVTATRRALNRDMMAEIERLRANPGTWGE
jgi:enoyl-CoA hydratase